MPNEYADAALKFIEQQKTTTEAAAPEPTDEEVANPATSDDPMEAAAEAEVAAAKAPPPPPKPPAPALSAVAREKAELRRQQKLLAEREAQLKELEEAKKSGNALALLKAGGKTYADLTREVLGIQKKPNEAPAADENPDIKALREELAQERRFREETQARQKAKEAEEWVAKGVSDAAKKYAAKFPTVAALDLAPKAVEFLKNWVKEYGEPPDPTSDENSFVIALEAVEEEEAAQAKAWEERLTKLRRGGRVAGTPDASGAPKQAVDEAESEQAEQHETLSNSWTAPTKGTAPEPKTAEDYRARALRLIAAGKL